MATTPCLRCLPALASTYRRRAELQALEEVLEIARKDLKDLLNSVGDEYLEAPMLSHIIHEQQVVADLEWLWVDALKNGLKGVTI
tara:strand:- start:198 stop:452 length:255 start_codon:yes stop_codon:yes gene_type:complete